MTEQLFVQRKKKLWLLCTLTLDEDDDEEGYEGGCQADEGHGTSTLFLERFYFFIFNINGMRLIAVFVKLTVLTHTYFFDVSRRIYRRWWRKATRQRRENTWSVLCDIIVPPGKKVFSFWTSEILMLHIKRFVDDAKTPRQAMSMKKKSMKKKVFKLAKPDVTCWSWCNVLILM